MGHYIGIPTSSVSDCIRHQIGADICAFLMAGTVVTGKVNIYNCVLSLCTLHTIMELIGQG